MRTEVASICVAMLATPSCADPVFAPRSIAPHVYGGGWEYYVGGGIAAFDCNGDTLPELYAAGGAAAGQLFLNRSETRGDLVFEPVDGALSQTGIIGAYPLDIDSDGVLDLVLLRVGKNRLMRGLGDCRFAPSEMLGFDTGDRWTTAFSATWEDGARLPTLAFGNYVDRGDPDGPFEACDVNLLYRPHGDTYAPPQELTPGYCALSMLFTDWGRRGRADLRVSNDRHYYVRDGQEQMWAMERPPRLYGQDDGWNRHMLWGMGIATRDLDGDGLAEVYLTSMADQRLQILDPEADGPSYHDAPYETGATAQRPYTGGDGRPSTGWHAAFGDVDNDGWADLFVAKGNVEQMPGNAMKDPNNLLMGTADGRFTEAGQRAGIASFARSRGAALTDMNGDGLPDLAVVNRRAPLELYQNVSTGTGNWLAVTVTQDGINRGAVGAFVEVRGGGRRWTQEVTVGGGHAGGVAGPLHFGLGPVTNPELRVIWPDGTAGDWQRAAANRAVSVTRPD